MRGALTNEQREAIDQALRDDPIQPVIDLWDDLIRCGPMPPLSPELVRAILLAFRRERGNPVKV